MSIIITPISPERLAVSGDIVTELAVPFHPDKDRFHLAFSDGSLIAGEYDPEENRFHYQVEVEGSGIARVCDQELALEWRAEWVTIAVYQPTPIRAPTPMPLFEHA